MIGKRISPILTEIEYTLWEFEANSALPPQFADDGFRAAVKIFMSAMADKMWALQEDDNIPLEIRSDMAEKLGTQIKNLVKVYTGIDTEKLYKEWGFTPHS